MRTVRIAILLLILIWAAGHTWLERIGSTSWKEPLWVGIFPINDPKYLVLTVVDEPHSNKQSHGYATAGWTVAPATSRIIQRMAPLLGVQPVDESSPEVQRGLMVESLQGKRVENY